VSSELFITDDAKRVDELSRELEEILKRNRWPGITVVMMTQSEDRSGEQPVVVVGHHVLEPENRFVMRKHPQFGAALFHAIQFHSLALNDEMPDMLIAPMMHDLEASPENEEAEG
jgi:hypothetical protein